MYFSKYRRSKSTKRPQKICNDAYNHSYSKNRDLQFNSSTLPYSRVVSNFGNNKREGERQAEVELGQAQPLLGLIYRQARIAAVQA